MIRVAAVGDMHYDTHQRESQRHYFSGLKGQADLLLIAGDLTQSGSLEEAEALAKDLSFASVPVVTVLGNHDFHKDLQLEIMDLLRSVGVTVLEGESVIFQIGNESVGIMGMKGFGGGFYGACITEFGEPEMKAFAHHCKKQAEVLKVGLESINADYKFALLHFSPVEGTLQGERKEIYPFLGSYLLAEAIDSSRVNGVFHGHAHLGTEHATTPGGVPVRNVAQTVIRNAYKIYIFGNPSK